MAKKTRKTDAELTTMLKDWYLAAASPVGGGKWRERARKAMQFYDGSGQWEDGVTATLRAEGKPALTINRILPVINVIWGQQQKNRTEISLEARKRGTKAIAELGSALIKHGMEACNGYDAASDSFRDGIITGKGWMTVDQVYDRDPVTGELLVEAPNPLTIYEDPRNTAYDINHGEFVFRERFVTRSKLDAYYPGKADEAMGAMAADWAEHVEDADTSPSGMMAAIRMMLMRADADELTTGELSGVIVRECWYTTFERVDMASVMVGGQMVSARVNGKDDEKKLKSFTEKHPKHDIGRTTAVIRELHLAVMVGDLVLKREDDPLNGMTAYPYTRFSPYWMHGCPFGVVDNLIEPQIEHNRLRSQTLHSLNQNANPAWKGGNATPKGLQTIEEFGSTPGVYLDMTQFGGVLERIEPGQMSAGHFTLAEAAAADIREISGANPDITGTQTEQSESGRARLIRQEAGQTTLAPIVSNFYRTQSTLGDMIWEFVRHNEVYSPEEIEAIVDIDTLESLGGVAGAVEAMNRWDVGTYGVKTAPAKTSATYRDVQVGELQEFTAAAASLGLVMPPNVANALLVELIGLSSFPGGDKIAEQLKAQPALPAPVQAPSQPAQKPKPALAAAR